MIFSKCGNKYTLDWLIMNLELKKKTIFEWYKLFKEGGEVWANFDWK